MDTEVEMPGDLSSLKEKNVCTCSGRRSHAGRKSRSQIGEEPGLLLLGLGHDITVKVLVLLLERKIVIHVFGWLDSPHGMAWGNVVWWKLKKLVLPIDAHRRELVETRVEIGVLKIELRIHRAFESGIVVGKIDPVIESKAGDVAGIE